MSNSMGPDHTKQLSNLDQGPTYLQKFPPTPCQLRPMSNSMGPRQTKQLSSLTWVQTICKSSLQLPQLYPYVKQYGSRSDLTIVKPDLGLNYLQKFTATSLQMHPYVKQYGSRSDLTIVTPDPGPNYLQKFTSTPCQLHPYVKQHGSRPDQTAVKPDLGSNKPDLSETSLCQTAWVQIRPNTCRA